MAQQQTERVVRDSKANLALRVAKAIGKIQTEAITNHGYFSIAFSGGSLPKTVAVGLLSDEVQGEFDLQFQHWRVFFCDERCVAVDHEDSNYLLVKESLLDKLDESQQPTVVRIDNDLVNDPPAAAVAYEKALRAALECDSGVPKFDLLLLGMGPDGHTCSLFPGHKLLDESSCLIASIEDSPKPPPRRITMTYPLLNAARAVYYVATGESKAPVLTQIIGKAHDDEAAAKFPARRVWPAGGELVWFVDAAALPESKAE